LPPLLVLDLCACVLRDVMMPTLHQSHLRFKLKKINKFAAPQVAKNLKHVYYFDKNNLLKFAAPQVDSIHSPY